MSQNLLPGKRYLWRELAPRAALLTLTFKFVLPLAPFGLFQFKGSLGAAALFGVAFTIMFSLFGAYLMGSAPAVRFMERHSKDWWFIPFNLAIVIALPAAALWAATLAVGDIFVISGLPAFLVGAVVLNIACAVTHDYGKR